MAAHTTDLRTSILCLSLLSEVASQLAGCFLQACVLLSAVVQSQSGLAVVLCLTPQAAFYGVLEILSTLGATERSLHCKGPPRPLAAWAEQLVEPCRESEHCTLQG